MESVAIVRKNGLFAGSTRGGRAAATFFTLLESCRRSGHNTFDYMADILARIGDHSVNRLDELLPDKWQPTAADSPPPPAWPQPPQTRRKEPQALLTWGS